ncbi:L-serine ammonia-lyase, iron-sulfur-dependent subunit beta [Erysipelothrix urinaevulpis]|uniref:L-serine ammonia-lyase, iron-sulfur-dependent subunit beta n=1 Tax=Erysipelothrix urinaevulpis TaxID=2683717 RepID=UPI0013582885|nr:L-serine ammonia-lyase, iron-sulfur-dependent subunit beta [Erysipelothrix urinaevulpis]
MAGKKFKSVFDIIGPVMVGPSSSHTAGAARIGKMARSLFPENPKQINVYLYESFAETYRGHGTDVALAGGLMGMNPDDDQLHESLILAQEKGIKINFIPLADKVSHPNTAKIVMRGDQEKMEVTGISIGGGSAEIIRVDGKEVNIDGKIPTILIKHIDQPGMISQVANVLSNLNLNVATMRVERESRGCEAYMVIEIDDHDEIGNAVEILNSMDCVLNVSHIDLREDSNV